MHSRNTNITGFKSEIHLTVYLAIKKLGVANERQIAMVLQQEHPREGVYRPESVRRIIAQLIDDKVVEAKKLGAVSRHMARKALKKRQQKLINELLENGIGVNIERAKNLLLEDLNSLYPEQANSNPKGSPTIYRLTASARKHEKISKPAGFGHLRHRALGNFFLLHATTLFQRNFLDHTVTEYEISTCCFEQETDSANNVWYVNGFSSGGKLPDCLISFSDKYWCWVEVEQSKKRNSERNHVASVRKHLGVYGRKLCGLQVNRLLIVHGYPESGRYMLDSLKRAAASYVEMGHGSVNRDNFESESAWKQYLKTISPADVWHYFMVINKRLSITKHHKKFYYWRPLEDEKTRENDSFLTLNRIREIEVKMGWASPLPPKPMCITALLDKEE